jgi:hypothetical protein
MNMSNAKPKAVAEINLEEFERRLRASVAPQSGVEDPLAELTRLVDTIGFERSAAERALEKAPKPAPKPELRLAPAPPAPAPPPAVTAPPAPAEIEPPPAPEAQAEPALRPSLEEEDLDSLAFEPPPPSSAAPLAEAPAARAAPPRARNWGLKVGGLIAAAAVMAGAVVVFKVGGHSHSGAPPLILASTAPTKVPPPNESTIRTANESGSLLNRDSAQPTPATPKLVDTPEAPVDLSARPSPSASAAPAPAPSPNASADADSSPVAPSANTPIVATVAPTATPMSPVGDDPNRVKTISVRPDGTLISSGYEANAAAAPAPAATPAPAAPLKAGADADAEASTPAVALPTKLSPPKSGERVAATETTAPADADAPPPVSAKPKKPKPKPTPVAEAEAKTDDGAADAAPAVPSGGYAVQLAAPKSESEAKALIKRFQTKFAGALGSTGLGVRKADRHGEAIYRVRAGGLSREDAKAMCDKIKEEGGDCYVAKN